MKKYFSSVMSVDYGNSNEGSCERELSDVESLLPDKNCLIRGKNYAFAIGRRIARGRFGAVYEVSKALFFCTDGLTPVTCSAVSMTWPLHKSFSQRSVHGFLFFHIECCDEWASWKSRRQNASYRSWCRRSKCLRILMLSWEYRYGLLLKSSIN